MDKILREIKTNVLLNHTINHTYFTKVAFIEGKSETSLEILNFLIINSASSFFVDDYLRMEYSKHKKKMSMKILFNASLDKSYV